MQRFVQLYILLIKLNLEVQLTKFQIKNNLFYLSQRTYFTSFMQSTVLAFKQKLVKGFCQLNLQAAILSVARGHAHWRDVALTSPEFLFE